MSIRQVVTYGPGGFDPTKPGSNVLSSQAVEVPDEAPSAELRIAELEAQIAELTKAVLS